MRPIWRKNTLNYKQRWSESRRKELTKPVLGGRCNLTSPHLDKDIKTEAEKVHNELNRIAKFRKDRTYPNISHVVMN
jgi:hypothetical protein